MPKPVLRTTHLDYLEKSGNDKVIREKSENGKCRREL